MSVPLQIGDNDLQVHRIKAVLRDDPEMAARWGIAMLNLMGVINRLVNEHDFTDEDVSNAVLEIEAAAWVNSTRQRQEEQQQ
jgi:hypothetical protein